MALLFLPLTADPFIVHKYQVVYILARSLIYHSHISFLLIFIYIIALSEIPRKSSFGVFYNFIVNFL